MKGILIEIWQKAVCCNNLFSPPAWLQVILTAYLVTRHFSLAMGEVHSLDLVWWYRHVILGLKQENSQWLLCLKVNGWSGTVYIDQNDYGQSSIWIFTKLHSITFENNRPGTMIWSRIYYVSILFSFSSDFNIKHRPAYHSNWNFNMIFRSLDTFIRLFFLSAHIYTLCVMWLTRCQSQPAQVSAPASPLPGDTCQAGDKSHVYFLRQAWRLTSQLRSVFAVDYYFEHVGCMSYVRLDWWETQSSRNICFFVQIQWNKNYTAGDSHFAAGMLLETDYRTLSLMCCGIVLLSNCVQACKVSHEQFLWRTNKSRVSAENCTSSNGIPSNPGVCRKAFWKGPSFIQCEKAAWG